MTRATRCSNGIRPDSGLPPTRLTPFADLPHRGGGEENSPSAHLPPGGGGRGGAQPRRGWGGTDRIRHDTRATRRNGFTLVEMLAVLAVLVILGAVLLPTITGLTGNSKLKAGVDTIKARMADARVYAMEQGRPYRVCIHTDGERIRLAPDLANFSELPVGGMPPETEGGSPSFVAEDRLPKGVTVVLVADEDDIVQTDEAGWTTVATFLDNGTCREVGTVLEIREAGARGLRLRLRGLTGATDVTPAPVQAGGLPTGGQP